MIDKIFFNLRNFIKVLVAAAILSLMFCGNVLALSFNTADYPGWCATSINNSGGAVTVNFACCADVGSGDTYSNDSVISLDINYPSTCTCVYTYDCGACTPGGTKTCSVVSTSPADASRNTVSCSNAPATTQSCIYSDTVAPTVSISAPVSGASVRGATVPITFGVTDNVLVDYAEVYVDGTVVGSVTVNSASASRYYTWNSTTVADGDHMIAVRSHDTAGNFSTKDSRNVTVDNVNDAPTVRITNPVNGDIVGGTVYVNVGAADDNSVYKVEIYIDGSLKVTDTSSPYEYTWYTANVAEGNHKLKVVAYDAAYLNGTAEIAVEVDNVAATDTAAPTVSITSPANGATVAGTVNVAARASDNNLIGAAGGIYQVKFYVDGGYVGSDTSSPYEYTWYTATAAEGDHKIKAEAIDVAGNTNGASITVTVDNIVASSGGDGSDNAAPEISITYPAEGATVSDKVTVTATASDAGGIYQVKFYVDGKHEVSDTSLPYSYIWNSTFWADGDHKLKAVAYDNSGKSADTEVSVKVNNSVIAVAPVICKFSCDKWDKCSADGKQICSEAVISPVGATCSNPQDSALTQDCKYDTSVICSYSCNKWGECSAANIQTCVEVAISPAGTACSNPLQATPVRDCAYTALTVNCVYVCDSWGECSSDGKRSCLKYSYIPAGANCTNTHPLSVQPCVYTAPVNEAAIEDPVSAETLAENGNNKEIVSNLKPKDRIRCEYSYSAYGACVNGRQARMLLSKQPDNCQEEVSAPVLEQECKALVNDTAGRPEDAPQPAPEAVTATGMAKERDNEQLKNYNGRTGSDWQKYYFGAENCQDSTVCGGDADPDNDGLNNNDEYRFGTDPDDADTDNDGYVDADEIKNRRDPLAAAPDAESDVMTLEDPKTNAADDQGIYAVSNVETVGGEKGKKISKLSGKALPNTYVTLYIYSDPIVMTVKTDKDGNWSYVLDKPLGLGNHEVYVAVTSNTGKIVAKSNAFAFAQTAEAAVALASPGDTEDRAPSPVKSRMGQGYLLVGFLSLVGVALAVVSIGIIRGKAKTN